MNPYHNHGSISNQATHQIVNGNIYFNGSGYHKANFEISNPARNQYKNDDVNADEDSRHWQDTEYMRRVVLNWLYFPGIDSRYMGISDTFENTFSWIFSQDSDGIHQGLNTNSPEHKDLIGFVSWLREGNGIFWINGKAGSGKSTLMKMIRNSPHTMEHLQHWTNGYMLVTGYFYFHDRGSGIGKSLLGLYRAILHQIFFSCPSLMMQTLGSSWTRLWAIFGDLKALQRLQLLYPQTSFYPPHSKAELTTILGNVLATTVSTVRLCLFIDGLDEYEGHDREIANVVTNLAKLSKGGSSWLKICVSSRPHASFEMAFANCKSIKLQDLTYHDISKYVYSHLNSHAWYTKSTDPKYISRFSQIVESVVEQAHGVFLWVQLAVMSLLDGLDQYDWIDDLEARVKALPPELEGFYDRMLKMINKNYRDSAARIFRIMLESDGQPHCLTLSFLEKSNSDIDCYTDGFSVEQLDRRSHQMAERLKSRCGGLIEVVDQYDNQRHWVSVYATFLHQTVREYFQQQRSWVILLEGNSVDWCPMSQFYTTQGKLLALAIDDVAKRGNDQEPHV